MDRGSLQLRRYELEEKDRQKFNLVLEEHPQTSGMECVVAIERVTKNDEECCSSQDIGHLRCQSSYCIFVARVVIAEATCRTSLQLVMQRSKCLNKGTVLGTLVPVEECSQNESHCHVSSSRCETEHELKSLQEFGWSSTRLSPRERGLLDRPLLDNRELFSSEAELLKPVVKQQVKEMLHNGIITPSASPWSSPVVLVCKRGDSYWFYSDYRTLNGITTKAYPLPRVDEKLDSLGEAQYFLPWTRPVVKIKVKVGVNPDDRQKTASSTPQLS